MQRRTPLKQKTPLKRNKNLSTKTDMPFHAVSRPRRTTKRVNLRTALKRTRNSADALLTPIIKILYPKCMLCLFPTQVAHHHVHKSKSTRLRYDLDNLIPLCHSCHFKLHQNESYWASRIVSIKGLDWFHKIDRAKDEIVKADVAYFAEHLIRLQHMHQELLTQEKL